MYWQTSRYQIDLTHPKVMGIVNVTPDSFSDGGHHHNTQAALRHCEQLLADGADILDIGGESTRPGAQELALEDELARIIPVVRGAVTLGVPVSVDTYKPRVMQAVLELGADIINDIRALRWPDDVSGVSAGQIVASHGRCGVCLMHMHKDPKTMQVQPMQGDAVSQVLSFLERSALDLQAMGIQKTRIVLDPGIGFGKTVEQNFALLAHQSALLRTGFPLLVGWSRKSALAGMTPGNPLAADERQAPSLAAALLSIERGAHIVRVHDVRETVQALRVWQEISLT